MKDIPIYGDYIQLDQFLKKLDYISSGGETGAFLEGHTITLNGNKVHEKERKSERMISFPLTAKNST